MVFVPAPAPVPAPRTPDQPVRRLVPPPIIKGGNPNPVGFVAPIPFLLPGLAGPA